MSSRFLCICLNRFNQTKYNPRTFPTLYSSNAVNYTSPRKKEKAKKAFCLFFFRCLLFSESLYLALTEGEHYKKIYTIISGFLRCFPSGSALVVAPINSYSSFSFFYLLRSECTHIDR